MKKTIFKAALAALIVSAPVAAYALQGNCVNCHTMHNSEMGAAVAETSSGLGSTTISGDPLPNLLRADCLACHAKGTANNVESEIPQVFHSGDDMAAGNFAYISGLKGTASDRAGHNVIDLFAADNDNFDANGAPPGNAYSSIHGKLFGAAGSEYENFTCAGTLGCHGTRGQIVSDEDIGNNNELAITRRTGMSALNGAHHVNTDGAKTDPGYTAAAVHDGVTVAAGYRFIPGLQGWENTGTRWSNISATDHNEYFGDPTAMNVTSSCLTCHNDGNNYGGDGGTGTKMTTDSNLKVPNNSMSGFCSTCHGVFHSTGTENGSSGAFLRHPSDYVLDSNVNADYGLYTVYNIGALVARPAVPTSASGAVNDGADMVMCLSCHKSHASEFDYMLRFDYTAQTSGSGTATDGCLACHSTKGAP